MKKPQPIMSLAWDHNLQQLVKRIAPCFVFHPDESYHLVDMSDYLAECDWRVNGKVVQPAPLSNALIDEKAKEHKEWCQGSLALKDGIQSSVLYGQKDLKVPLMVHAVEKGDYIYVQFITFYAFNGPLPVLGGWVWAGSHQADVEHVTAIVRNTSMALEGYYLSHHGEETFVPCHQLTKDPTTNKYVIYVAIGSHAHYATRGYFNRYYGATFDETAEGTHWVPRHFRYVCLSTEPGFNPETMGFMHIMGNLGNSHVANLASKPWFMNGKKPMAQHL